ncbi:uncharacterized protein LOC142617023 [Castanea sativa]|uniref:uncharacterized protein LOC142617023 n=1 Tax=Castanea sativa TaxID=21020 RepID=UPI003F651153
MEKNQILVNPFKRVPLCPQMEIDFNQIVESSKGLRQGDPLFPLLFVLVMEALGRMLDKVVHDGHMSGFSVGRVEGRSLVVSHLLFAEDTLIFCGADLDQVLFLHMIFIWFEVVSGLKINLGKSELVPVGAKFKDKAIWNLILEKIERRLAGWNHLPIASGGLGIRKTRLFNKALLEKWLWRFGMGRAALWRPVNGPYGVGLWKNISQGWPSFSRHILYDIGDESRVKFWQDHWYGETSLTVSYPELYRFCRTKEASVAELIKLDNGVLFWDVSFFRGVHA